MHEALFTESMPLLLDNLPKEHAFEIIMQKDNNGNTALHYSAFSEQRLSRLLQAIPEAKRLEAIREKSTGKDTSIFCEREFWANKSHFASITE